jgi:hypothetical protein
METPILKQQMMGYWTFKLPSGKEGTFNFIEVYHSVTGKITLEFYHKMIEKDKEVTSIGGEYLPFFEGLNEGRLFVQMIGGPFLRINRIAEGVMYASWMRTAMIEEFDLELKKVKESTT